MFIWHYVSLKKYEHDLLGTVPLEWLLALGQNVGDARVPGIGLVYTDLVSGVPPNFSRFVTNLPAYHRVLVFVCIKYVSVPFVTPAERYLVGRVGPAEHRSYRCIVRYGYRDVRRDANSFESELISSLADFLKREDHCNNFYATQTLDGDDRGLAVVASSSLDEMKPGVAKTVTFDEVNETNPWLSDRAREELKDLHEATEVGATFILGRSDIRTKPVSPITKKLALMVYNILKANCRGPEVALRVPPESLFEVGMVYDL
ncbi:hypothetical protein HPP92_018450 [Vanilla planifolia]|uniref:K+ potassium transporter C-terminal domain-containing protein n=1 Tax=Vanilla planifolia TaxID=51239 RepID=A0A835QK12_VANPL|nr:hypothetical protein HPP92_018450 [Vanilla planifolia]